MRRLLSILLLTFLFVPPVLAQPHPDTLWTRQINVFGDERAYCVAPTADGFGYLIGASMLWLDIYECVVIRLNNIGGTFWSDIYGGIDDDEARWVAETATGQILLVGRTQSWGAGATDVWLLRATQFGDSLWAYTYGSSSSDWGTYVEETPEGGILIAGYTSGFEATEHDFYVIKTDRRGIELWHRTYGREFSDECYSAKVVSDSGFIFAGVTEAPEFPYPGQMYLVRANANGDTLWTRDYGGTNHDQANAVWETSDGNFVMAGYTQLSTTNKDVLLVKVNGSNGDTLWTRQYESTGDQWAYSVQETSEGGLILAGYTLPSGSGQRDVLVIKTDGEGNVQWTRTYGRANRREEAYCIRETADHGYVISGAAFPSAADGDIYVIKTGPDSLLTSAAEEPLIPHPSSFVLSAYPNPFNPQTTLSFVLPQAGAVSLKIYDVAGREVRTLFEGRMAPGQHELDFDGAGLPSGLYFARLSSPHAELTHKLLLVK